MLFTDTIFEAKRRKRKVDKQMKRTGLTVHNGMFKMTKTELRVLVLKSKAEFYNRKITNSKSLFKVVDTLKHHNSSMLSSYAYWCCLPYIIQVLGILMLNAIKCLIMTGHQYGPTNKQIINYFT